MKRVAAIFILAFFISAATIPSFAGPFARQDQQKKGPIVPMADAMDGFYIKRIQAGVDLTDEQFGKIVPFLLRMLKEDRDITARRNRLMNQLRQATAKGPQQPKRDATDEELAKLTHDLDQTAAERLASRQDFLKNVDPLLNERQRARLRVFQENIEKTILNLINSIQNSTPPPQNPAPQPAPKNPSQR